MNKKLIIFDLDGTLLDTIEDLANATNHALTQFNLPTHPVEAFRFFVGNGINNLILKALPEDKKNQDNVSMLRPEFLKYYYAHGEECTKPYAGISELIKELKSKGYLLGVASNKIHQATVTLVDEYFGEGTFHKVYGQRENIAIKPDPSVLIQIMDELQVEKENVLYIGDSGVDAATAINAGVDFIGVLWGFRPESELRAAGAINFIKKPSELSSILV